VTAPPTASRRAVTVATVLSRAGTAGLVLLVVLDLAGAVELAGAVLAVAAVLSVLWLGPPLALTAAAAVTARRGDRASWRGLQDRLVADAAEEPAPGAPADGRPR